MTNDKYCWILNAGTREGAPGTSGKDGDTIYGRPCQELVLTPNRRGPWRGFEQRSNVSRRALGHS